MDSFHEAWANIPPHPTIEMGKPLEIEERVNEDFSTSLFIAVVVIAVGVCALWSGWPAALKW